MEQQRIFFQLLELCETNDFKEQFNQKSETAKTQKKKNYLSGQSSRSITFKQKLFLAVEVDLHFFLQLAELQIPVSKQFQ